MRDWGREEKGTTEDEMAGWHHRLNGHEFEWTPGVGDGQGGLACCDSWGRRESDMTERLNWLNRTDLNMIGIGRNEGGKERKIRGRRSEPENRKNGWKQRKILFFSSPTNPSQPPETTNMIIYKETHIHTYRVFLCINMCLLLLFLMKAYFMYLFMQQ